MKVSDLYGNQLCEIAAPAHHPVPGIQSKTKSSARAVTESSGLPQSPIGWEVGTEQPRGWGLGWVGLGRGEGWGREEHR